MNYYWISTIAIIYLVFLTIRKPQKEKKEISTATMAISNCLFSPTSENPQGFSVWCVLAKLSA